MERKLCKLTQGSRTWSMMDVCGCGCGCVGVLVCVEGNRRAAGGRSSRWGMRWMG